MGSEIVPECVTACRFGNIRSSYGFLDLSLKGAWLDMMTQDLSILGMYHKVFRGKYPLPGPFLVGIRILFLHGIGKRCTVVSFLQIFEVTSLYSLQMGF